MNMFFVVPLLLGLSVVIQGMLNRNVAVAWGLSSAVLLNAVVFLILSLFLFLFVYFFNTKIVEYAEFLKLPTFEFEKFKFWFLIPGLCGFFLVFGVPWSLNEIGSTKTFVLLITSQVIVSLFVDYYFFKNSISSLKLIGSILALFGATLVALN